MPSIWKDDFKKLHGGNKIWVSIIDAETELFICTGYQAWEAAGRPKLIFWRIMLACQLRLNEVWTYEYELSLNKNESMDSQAVYWVYFSPLKKSCSLMKIFTHINH